MVKWIDMADERTKKISKIADTGEQSSNIQRIAIAGIVCLIIGYVVGSSGKTIDGKTAMEWKSAYTLETINSATQKNKAVGAEENYQTCLTVSKDISDKQKNIDSCLQIAWQSYNERWNGSCKALDKGDNCSLAHTQAEGYENIYQKDKSLCLERYK